MAIGITSALRFISQDQRFLFELLLQMDDQKIRHREGVEEILERWLVQQLTDDEGYLLPGALTEDQVNEFETELMEMYSPDRLDDAFAEVVGLVDARLLTADDLMRNLELEDGILGNAVFEMDTVQEQIDSIAEGFVRGARGEGDYEGSLQRIKDSMNRYRFDRNKPEFTLRTELMETLERDANVGANHSNSVSKTAMAVIDRELRRVQARDAGIEHGLYSGVHDDLIRPFCDEWLGKVESYAFWDALRNDMPEGLFDFPVSINCGGINCRHRIIPWVLDWSDGDRDLRERFAQVLQDQLRKSMYPMERFYTAA